jgi:hypothetical protein
MSNTMSNTNMNSSNKVVVIFCQRVFRDGHWSMVPLSRKEFYPLSKEDRKLYRNYPARLMKNITDILDD